jgi:hypothetical protein
MSKYIWLKTAKVVSHDADGMAKVDKSTVKLESGKCFQKFVDNMHLHNFIKSTPPEVVKVVDRDGKTYETESYQLIVNNAIGNRRPKSKIDYKAEYEKSQDTIKNMMSRLEALESPRDDRSEERIELEFKANDLGVKFRSTISDKNLEEKINNKINS